MPPKKKAGKEGGEKKKGVKKAVKKKAAEPEDQPEVAPPPPPAREETPPPPAKEPTPTPPPTPPPSYKLSILATIGQGQREKAVEEGQRMAEANFSLKRYQGSLFSLRLKHHTEENDNRIMLPYSIQLKAKKEKEMQKHFQKMLFNQNKEIAQSSLVRKASDLHLWTEVTLDKISEGYSDRTPIYQESKVEEDKEGVKVKYFDQMSVKYYDDVDSPLYGMILQDGY